MWLTQWGAQCRRLLFAGQDAEACTKLVVLDHILIAARTVYPKFYAGTTLCSWVSPHVNALEVAKKSSCAAATKLLGARDPVGLANYQRSLLVTAGRAFEDGLFEKAGQILEDLAEFSPNDVPVLATEARVEQFVRHLFPTDSVRLTEKRWSEEHFRVLHQYYEKKRREEYYTVNYCKFALAIDVERDLAVTKQWLVLGSKFGQNISRLTFGHDDFSGAQNVRYWLDRGTENGRNARIEAPQTGENLSPDAYVSFLRLSLRSGCFAQVVGPNAPICSELIDFVRTNLTGASPAREDLVAYLQALRRVRRQEGPHFLPVLLDWKIADVLPQEVRTWIEQA